MRKSFLRAPVNFKYISSNFNPRRLHPVTGKVRPHNGIDYVAPVGTPSWRRAAAAWWPPAITSSTATTSSSSTPGNYVTKYLHLSKRTVNKGQRGKQGRPSACSAAPAGSQARTCTMNSWWAACTRTRALNLPQAESLSGRALASFKAQAMPQLAKLDSPELQLARNKGNGDDS